jgi:hypothetical protein
VSEAAEKYVQKLYNGGQHGQALGWHSDVAGAFDAGAASRDAEMRKYRETLQAASHGLRSYQYGNIATDLAEEMADTIDALLSGTRGAEGGPRAWRPARMSDVEIYSEGFCCMSVCSVLSPQETVDHVNRASPSGTTNGWRLSSDKEFRQGEPNPCPCDRDAARTHYLLNC